MFYCEEIKSETSQKLHNYYIMQLIIQTSQLFCEKTFKMP